MADAPFSLPAGLPADPALLATLLNLLPMGVMYYTPVVDATGTLTDLTLAYLNPTAQRMARLPAQPDTTYRQQFPTTDDNGAWDFHRRSWLGQQAEQFRFYYQADGFDAYFRVTAQRLGPGLLVVFTDPQDEDRSPAEEALRATQAREQAARAAAEARQAVLYAVFEQAPVAISLLQGPTHVIEFANARMAQLWDRSLAQVVGQPHFTALPELAGQGFEAVLDAVWRTGEPYYLQEQLVSLRRAGQPDQGYFNIAYQPSYDAQGQRTGVLTSAIDVTEQVLARQQVEQLNAELEARVQARTQEAQLAQATAERERNLLQAVLTQAPVAIGFFQGEELRIMETNAQMATLWGRTPEQVLGQPFMDAVPELRGQGFDEQMRQVLATQVPYVGTETPATMLRHGQLQTTYYNFVYQPLYDTAGQLLGVIDVATEVTEQVLARRQVEQLNQELEARVAERTQQLAVAQAAAERERAQLQALLTQAPVAIGLFAGEELRVSTINPQMAALLGYTPAQLLGHPLFEQAPELRGQGFDEQMRQVLRTQVPYVGQEVAATVQRNGEPVGVYFNFVYQPLYDAEGQVSGVLNVAVDVTEQVRARQQVEQLNQELESRVRERTQEALALQGQVLAAAQRQAQEREAFYQVFEQTSAVVALLRGPDHRYEYVNPTYQALLPGRRLVGSPVAEVAPELVAQGFGALLDRVYQTGATYFGDELPFTPEPLPGQAPRTAYYNFTYQAYREASLVVGVAIVAFDVTEQVLVRQQQQGQQQRLRHVFAQAPVAIFVLRGTDYVFDVVNESMGQMLNMDPDSMLGKDYFELLPSLEAQGYRQLLDQVWHTGQEVVAQEQATRLPHHGENETGYYNFTYVALREADGRVAGIMCVAVEVTSQVLTRQQVQVLNEALTATNVELHHSNQQLTRTNADLDTFVYAASHDLKAPIANIEGLLTVLREYLPTEAQEPMVPRLVGMMEGAIARFQQTVGHLTDVSRLQSEHTPAGVATDLAAVLADVRLDLQPLLESTQAELVLDLAACPPVALSAKHLRSVLFNLLSNAVKYRAPDRRPQVHVRTQCTATQLVLEVQDNGLGLDATQQTQLFAMFRRLHTHVEGSGVGLYLLKRTLENAGGTITVQSEPGVGSTFTVVIPQP